ncbi:hypothetical protein PLESTM_000654800 [Pleodorina starrii]|nr:hypothetical protein PLESTM_000654800 [Pleodorina starrii]
MLSNVGARNRNSSTAAAAVAVTESAAATNREEPVRTTPVVPCHANTHDRTTGQVKLGQRPHRRRTVVLGLGPAPPTHPSACSHHHNTCNSSLFGSTTNNTKWAS